MKKINQFILPSVFFFLSVFVYAQPPGTGTPPGAPGVPGAVGPGRQSSPIDMYVYFLAIAAILMIAYFAKRYKTQKI